ncbi:MAG: sel1 repeat family protein [Rhodobacteraceae bacterium]|nr:sel1 repeat family protein [Paracoccaceae bacterium]
MLKQESRAYKTLGVLAAILLLGACALSTREHSESPPDVRAETEQDKALLERIAAMPLADLQALADEGNVKAKIELAARYANGNGVEVDTPKAIALLDEAIAAGDSQAMFFRGVMAHNGMGVPVNMAEAVLWYEKSAAKGNMFGEYWLAFMIGNGLGGISPNWPGAVPLLEKAAAQNHSDAQFMLGWLYESGEGGQGIDYEKAGDWYRKATATHLNQKAQFNLINLLGEGKIKWREGDPVIPKQAESSDSTVDSQTAHQE